MFFTINIYSVHSLFCPATSQNPKDITILRDYYHIKLTEAPYSLIKEDGTRKQFDFICLRNCQNYN